MSALNFNNLTKSKTTRLGVIGSALQILATAFTTGTVGLPALVMAASTLILGLFAGDHDGQPTPPADPQNTQKI